MNDVRARFLKSILEQLPAERIVELHFFTPIRQGPIETGVAVIAAEPERSLPVAEEVPAVEAALDVEVALAMEAAGGAAGGAAAVTTADAEVATDDADAETASAADDDSPYAGLPDEAGIEAIDDDIAAYAETPAPPRFEVITALYRWTRKGPERGKWEVDITTEADAPLPTVGTVVQGVHDRAGEELEPLRLTHAELQALLDEPSWQTTP